MAFTTEQIPKLNIDKLIKNGYIKDGKQKEGSYQDPNNIDFPSLELFSDLTGKEKWLKIFHYREGELTEHENKITVIRVKTNLPENSGFNFYWKCNKSGLLSKILYYDYLTGDFVNRSFYPYRIYHPLQLCSKAERAFLRGHIVRKKLLKGLLEYKKYKHAGQLIKSHNQLDKLISKDQIIQLLKDEREQKIIQKFGYKNPY